MECLEERSEELEVGSRREVRRTGPQTDLVEALSGKCVPDSISFLSRTQTCTEEPINKTTSPKANKHITSQCKETVMAFTVR